MEDLHRRLDERSPLIRELMKLGGMPGLSLSVATKGHSVYHASYGFRDVDAGLPITPDTIFPVCSLAKGVSAAAMGILVEQGATTWDTLARDGAPQFRPRDRALEESNTTIADLYSHRSGMSSCGQLVGGCEGNVLVNKGDIVAMLNHQTLVPDQRGVFSYNSTAYDLCDEVLESLSGTTVDEFVRKNVFEPLGLQRTSMTPPPPPPPPFPASTENVTKSYNALDDGTPVCIPAPKVGMGGVSSGSGGLQSCATDLMKLYGTIMCSFNHERETGQTCTPGSPFSQVARLMSAHVPMGRDGSSYGLGWARAQMPCSLGKIGLNGRLMPQDMPVIGKDSSAEGAGQLVLYHQGTLPGALATVILLPDTGSVILVMGNSLALTDVPDWVAQMVIEELLNTPAHERVDFLACARLSVSINLKWYDCIVDGLEQGRPETIIPHRPLASYVGSYIDGSGVFKVVIKLVRKNGRDRLYWAFQGRESESYQLEHYTGDTFTWLQPRNELSRRGRWVLGNDRDADFWKVVFVVDENGGVDQVRWRHDPRLDHITYTRCRPQDSSSSHNF